VQLQCVKLLHSLSPCRCSSTVFTKPLTCWAVSCSHG
jgi:hypothetical protein